MHIFSGASLQHSCLFDKRDKPTPLCLQKSLLEYGIDFEMWLLLCDECSQPQESHDGCFNFRTFLIS